MKKINVVVTVILAFAMLLSACAVPGQRGSALSKPTDAAGKPADQNAQSAGSGKSADGQVISIALHDSPWLPAVQAMAPVYEQQTGHKIDLHVFPYNGLYEKLVTASAVKHSEFDLVFMDQGWLPMLYSVDYITPINEVDPNYNPDPEILEYDYFTRWNKEKQYPTADGTLMTLPINGNLQLLFYRTDILEELGVAPPKTWEEVESIAQKVHDPKNNIYGFVTGGQTGNRVAYDFLPFLYSHGGSLFADAASGDLTVTIHNDAGKRAVDTWLNLMTKYGPPNIGDVTQADVMSYLTTGKVAMGLTVAAQYSFMDNPKYSVVQNKIGYVVPPAGEGGNPASVSGPFLMGIPRGSDNKEAALDFMKWITSKEVQIEYAKAGAVPIRSDVYDSEIADLPELRYLKAMKEAAKYSVSRPGVTIYPQFEDILGLYLNKALIGQISGEEALAKIAEEASKIAK
ncbi:ABC transporter substrate-binding protein [Paenibacillus cisolokensis]|jgi:ABC-type sugar transport system, periplasmic component|uniref:ABC transporter substrate-binding protein n=1 Tax=Paenibacillus cisolokensis TaxID=1658519 RepID=A0ABQ4N0F1_9BACL|nr:extracellular solute-binding protein [Paenibacillus cisolokensis]GIQ61648.1 ABC transporter substrate-binding protein [Paenibacillus cisolokensis]